MKTLSRINRNWRQRGNLTKSGDVSIVNSRSSYNDDLEDEVISFSSSLPRFAKKQDTQYQNINSKLEFLVGSNFDKNGQNMVLVIIKVLYREFNHNKILLLTKNIIFYC